AFNHRLLWREIAPRPSDPAEAWAVLSAVVHQHVGRLKELLAHHQASAAAEDADWADRAALDCSPALERHRRYQSAKTRELLRTLDTLRKLRNADFGMGNAEKADGKCRMADGRWQMTADAGRRTTNAKWQMTNGRWQMTADAGRRTTNAKWQMMNGRWQMTADAGRRTTNAKWQMTNGRWQMTADAGRRRTNAKWQMTNGK